MLTRQVPITCATERNSNIQTQHRFTIVTDGCPLPDSSPSPPPVQLQPAPPMRSLLFSKRPGGRPHKWHHCVSPQVGG